MSSSWDVVVRVLSNATAERTAVVEIAGQTSVVVANATVLAAEGGDLTAFNTPRDSQRRRAACVGRCRRTRQTQCLDCNAGALVRGGATARSVVSSSLSFYVLFKNQIGTCT